MDKPDRTVVELEKWGDKTLDHARCDGMVVGLQKQLAELRAENRLLNRGLGRAVRAHQRCRKTLTSRRKRNS